MKNVLFALVGSLLLMTGTGCSDHNNISITVTDSKSIYQLAATFDKRKTEKVLASLNDALGPTNVSPTATVLYNGKVTLDDETTVDIKSAPGKLRILLNKRENSYESYIRVKKMFEKIGAALKE